jgi:hypothetical protein
MKFASILKSIVAVALTCTIPSVAAAQVKCQQSKISAIHSPTGSAESQAGDMQFSDGRSARLDDGITSDMQYMAKRNMRVGDHVTTCIDAPYYNYRGGPPVSQIAVMDGDADFIFVSLYLPK